jgi:hypothetical protein
MVMGALRSTARSDVSFGLLRGLEWILLDTGSDLAVLLAARSVKVL